jgi:hypothetical protein
VTVKDRSLKTGVSSGQEKDRFEHTTEASDMEMTSEYYGQRELCPEQTWERRYDEPATSAALPQRVRWPSDPGLTPRCRLHPPRL